MNAIVCQVTIGKDLCMSPRTIWEVPAMCFCAIVADQADCAWGCEVGEECVSRRDRVEVDASQAKPTAM